MSPERLEDPDAQELIELAIINMKSAIAYFHGFPSPENLLTTAFQVWHDINSNEEIKTRIEEDFKQKRMALNQMGMLDTTEGDPVRKRYDPYHWADKVPQEYAFREGDYVLDCSQRLLDLLKIIANPPDLT